MKEDDEKIFAPFIRRIGHIKTYTAGIGPVA